MSRLTVGRGAVAQMGERCNRTAEVRGSIPLSSTSPYPILSLAKPIAPDARELVAMFVGVAVRMRL